MKIRAAWRAFGRCAHLFFVVRMTSRPALPLSPCHARLPRSKRVKMWLRLGFAEMLPSLCRSLGPSFRGPPPDPNATLEISSLSFSHSFPLVPLFLQNPITKDSFHRGERAIRGLVCRSLATCIPSPFRESRCFDRLKIVISESGCRSEIQSFSFEMMKHPE